MGRLVKTQGSNYCRNHGPTQTGTKTGMFKQSVNREQLGQGGVTNRQINTKQELRTIAELGTKTETTWDTENKDML